MTHDEAEKHCTDHLNSSLAFFTMATMYFKLPQTLHLYLDKYWVGGNSFHIIIIAIKESTVCIYFAPFYTIFCFENSFDQDQLASGESSWSGSTLSRLQNESILNIKLHVCTRT